MYGVGRLDDVAFVGDVHVEHVSQTTLLWLDLTVVSQVPQGCFGGPGFG